MSTADPRIAVAAIVMVVGVATGFVAGQLMTTLGAPYGASTAMMRVVTVVLLAICAFLTTVIANAVIDGTDAVMLSAETATGKHVAKVVEAMDRICRGAGRRPGYRRASVYHALRAGSGLLAGSTGCRQPGSLVYRRHCAG